MSNRVKSVFTIWGALLVVAALVVAFAPPGGQSKSSGDSSAAAGAVPGAAAVTATRLPKPNRTAIFAARRACARGDLYLSLKMYDAAAGSYAKAAGIDRCADRGAAKLADATAATDARTSAMTSFTLARAYQDAGMSAEADAATAAGVKADPSVEVPAELRSAAGYPGAVQREVNRAAPWLKATGLALAVVFLLGLVSYLAFVIWRTFAGTHLRLRAVTGAEGGQNEHLTAVLSQELGRVGEASPDRPGLRVVRETEVKLPAADDIEKAFAPAGAIARLVAALPAWLQRFEPRAQVTVLQPDPDRGIGVTIDLRGIGHRPVNDTLWERDYGLLASVKDAGNTDDLAGRAQRLMLPAAIWIASEGGRVLRVQKAPAGEHEALPWQSVAHAAAGAVAHQRGRLAVAEAQYRQSLDHSVDNVEARYNLASLLLQPRRGEGGGIAAKHRLQRVSDLLAPLKEKLDPADLRRLRAEYIDVIAHIYANELTTATAELRALRGALGGMRDATTEAGSVARRLDGLCIGLEHTIGLLGGEDLGPYLGDGTWTSGELQYNAACYLARRYGAKQNAADREDAIDRLREAFASVDQLARITAQTDPAFSAIADDQAFKALVFDAPTAAAKPEAEQPRRLAFYATADGPIAVEVDA